MTFVPKIKIEVAVVDDVLENVVMATRENSNTAKTGDGKTFVFEISEAVRIRTGEAAAEALQRRCGYVLARRSLSRIGANCCTA